MVRFSKDHIRQLPVNKFDLDYPRDSKDVSLSIPLFHSPKGVNANFNRDMTWNKELFQDIVCKGAALTAISIATNTDLCTNGMPIYFHVEDVVYDDAISVFNQFGIPEDWVRKTSFKPPSEEQLSYDPVFGKKFGVFFDEKIDTDVVILWDSDSLVYREMGDPILKWYKYFQEDLSNTLMLSFYSKHDGGEKRFVDWLRRGANLPELSGDLNGHELKHAENEAYSRVDLEPSDTRYRWGSAMASFPMNDPIVEFLKKWSHESHNDEGIISMWMNSVAPAFIEFENLFIPFIKTDDDFLDTRKSCIAHPFGEDKGKILKYINRLDRGINGLGRDKKKVVAKSSRKRIHVISVPHNPSNKLFSTCAFAQKDRKLNEMLDYTGHENYSYGNELADVNCSEFIQVTSADDLHESYGDFYDQSELYKFSESDYAYKKFFLNTEYELRKRVMPGDFVCYTFAPYQKTLYNSIQDLPVRHVESGIGYYYPFMKYKVFESYAHMHFQYGIFQGNYNRYRDMSDEEKKSSGLTSFNTVHHSFPQWQDAVIPNSFDVEDFEYSETNDDYFLYIGRIIKGKGIEEAMRISHYLGKKLVIAGQGDFVEALGFEPWDNVELVGRLGIEDRKKYYAGCIAVFCLSTYPDAFCGVHIEAALSGKPVISTDFGAFVDTLKHKKTGYRVRLLAFDEGVWAAKNIDKISPKDCREWGLKFSNENIALKYDYYFDSIEKYENNNKSPYWYVDDNKSDLNLVMDPI